MVKKTRWVYQFVEQKFGVMDHLDQDHDRIYKYNYDEMTERLDELGREGWEVISVIEKSGHRLLFTLKKPIASL